MTEQLSFFGLAESQAQPTPVPFARCLADFREFGSETRQMPMPLPEQNGITLREITTYVNEFWTAKQRQAHSLHEISYRACFKPQLPRFFIERLTRPGDVVYDPFMGRGTTPLEAALLGRIPFGCDINPLSQFLTRPRLTPPKLPALKERLESINLTAPAEFPEELLVFYHPHTLRAIAALKHHLLTAFQTETATPEDNWIRMVALNRLTGHSPGFFSVYTLPPNQAVSVKSQEKINQKRNQTPPERDVRGVILKKSRILLSDCSKKTEQVLRRSSRDSLFVCGSADHTPQIPDGSVALVVTSPPFLNIVDYATDNWLRCWFAGIDPKTVRLTVPRRVDEWEAAMTRVFAELRRVVRPGGYVAFEVGEVHRGETLLEHSVVRSALAAGLNPELLMINDQKFTKTANCWGVNNMSSGTNTNRIVLLRKD